MIDKIIKAMTAAASGQQSADPVQSSPLSEAEQLQNLLPNVVNIMLSNVPADPLMQASDTISDCNVILADITKRLNDAANLCIIDCADSIDKCCGCIRSKSQITAEQVSAVLDKCQGKLLKAISDRYSGTVAYLTQLGCSFPQPEIVSAIMQGVEPAEAIKTLTVHNAAVAGVTGGPGNRLQCPVGTIYWVFLGNVEGCVDPTTCKVTFADGSIGFLNEGQCLTIRNQPNGWPSIPIPPPIKVIIPPPPPPAGGPPGSGTGVSPTPPPVKPPPVAPGGPIIALPTGPGNLITGEPGSPPPSPPPPPSGGGGPPPPPPPPPIFPPSPPPPPPTIVNGVCCYPPIPAEPIGCVIIPILPPAPQYWSTCKLDCSHGGLDVCIWRGNSPPVVPKGEILHGPFGSADEARAACVLPVNVCAPPTEPTGSGGGGTVCKVKGKAPCHPPGGHTAADICHISCDTTSADKTQWTVTFWFSRGGGPCPNELPPFEQLPEDSLTVFWGSEPEGFPGPPHCTDQPIMGHGGQPSGTSSWIGYCGISPNAGDLSLPPPPSVGEFNRPVDKGSLLGWVLDVTGLASSLPYGDNIVKGLYGVITSTVGAAIAELLPCEDSHYGAAVATQVGLGLFHKAGLIPESMAAAIDYTQNYYCQYKLPDNAGFNSAYISGLLSHDQWEYGMRVNGNCLPWANRLIEGQWNYPKTQEAAVLYRRGFISHDDFSRYARLDGSKDAAMSELHLSLSQFVPSVSDTSLWWVRQLNDERFAVKEGLDDGFEGWFNDLGGKAAASAGMDLQTARKIYRSSRRMPDLSTVMEGYRRIGPVAPIPGLDRDAKVITNDELNDLLAASGIPQVWADRVAYLSYTPISIRHLRLLYQSGQSTEADLAERYGKLGYSPADAALLAHAIAVTTAPAKAKIEGKPTVADILKLFKDDGLDEQLAESLLVSAGVSADAATDILLTANTIRAASARTERIKALKRRYLQGRYSSVDVQTKLTQYGVIADRVTLLMDQWKDELDLRNKEPTVSVLCDWRSRGLIDDSTYQYRLVNLGYDAGDAANFIEGCNEKRQEKERAAAVKAAKEATAAIQKQVAAAKKAEKERVAAQKAAAKAARDADPFRDPPKPYRTPKVTRTHKITESHKDKGPPPVTTTDTVSESSG